MRNLNLFLDLMGIIHNLQEVGVTGCAAYEALMQINSVFDDFEENDGVASPDSHKIFEDVFFTACHMPEELQQYFHTLENFHTRKTPYLNALSPRVDTTEQVELMAGVFDTLNELLEAGINACNNHQARMKINDLFFYFLEVDDTPQAEHSSTILEDENENINKEGWLESMFDYIAIKQEQTQALPQQVLRDTTREQRQLMAGLFSILMDLLEPSVTIYNARKEFSKIDSLFLPFEHENQEMADDENEDSLSHLFPDMKQKLDRLSLFPL